MPKINSSKFNPRSSNPLTLLSTPAEASLHQEELEAFQLHQLSKALRKRRAAVDACVGFRCRALGLGSSASFLHWVMSRVAR